MTTAQTCMQVLQTIAITNESHVVLICQQARMLAARLRFSNVEQTALTIAISEISHNMLKHAGHGKITLAHDEHCIIVTAADDGPGIASIEQAMRDGYTSGGGLGMGLPGAKRLMDSLEIESVPGQGTTIKMRKCKDDD